MSSSTVTFFAFTSSFPFPFSKQLLMPKAAARDRALSSPPLALAAVVAPCVCATSVCKQMMTPRAVLAAAVCCCAVVCCWHDASATLLLCSWCEGLTGAAAVECGCACLSVSCCLSASAAQAKAAALQLNRRTCHSIRSAAATRCTATTDSQRHGS